MGIIAVREIIIHPGTLEGHSQNNGDYRTIIELNVYIGWIKKDKIMSTDQGADFG